MKSFLLIFFALMVLVSCDSKKGSYKKVTADIEPLVLSNPDSLIGREYRIDAVHSYLGFKIKYFGFSPVRGRFEDFQGYVFYDDENLSSLSVTLQIDASTINTANERRDNDLTREGAWFDVKNHPHMLFQSKRVKSYLDGHFDLIGDLTIKGITKRDTFRFDPPTPVTRIGQAMIR